MMRPPPISTLFPYTTLFRSQPLRRAGVGIEPRIVMFREQRLGRAAAQDRKSTRLNSSHGSISYAVFCLKKKTHTQLQVLVLDFGPPASYSGRRVSTLPMQAN